LHPQQVTPPVSTNEIGVLKLLSRWPNLASQRKRMSTQPFDSPPHTLNRFNHVWAFLFKRVHGRQQFKSLVNRCQRCVKLNQQLQFVWLAHLPSALNTMTNTNADSKNTGHAQLRFIATP
jgi:hypothetical protein